MKCFKVYFKYVFEIRFQLVSILFSDFQSLIIFKILNNIKLIFVFKVLMIKFDKKGSSRILIGVRF